MCAGNTHRLESSEFSRLLVGERSDFPKTCGKVGKALVLVLLAIRVSLFINDKKI
jgi:hypothetical protein